MDGTSTNVVDANIVAMVVVVGVVVVVVVVVVGGCGTQYSFAAQLATGQRTRGVSGPS